jgi:outer membrane protein
MLAGRPITMLCAVILSGLGASALRAQTGGITLLDALRTTVARHAELTIQREQVNIQRGLQQQAAARFDTLVSADLSQARQNWPLAGGDRDAFVNDGVQASSHTLTDLTSLRAGARRTFRSGLAVSLDTELTRTSDNLLYDAGVSRSATRLGLSIPTVGGRGRAIVAADEIAAGLETGSSRLDVTQTIARLVANTTETYWNVVAAKTVLAVARGSEERGRLLRDNVQTLIDAGRTPQNDIHNVAANLAERTANRIAAEQRIIDLRRLLAVQMGLDVATLAELPDTVDPLPPEPPTAAPPDAASVECFIAAALRNRADIRANRTRVEAAEARVVGARDLFRPRLDLTLSLGYAGLREGLGLDSYMSSLLQGGHGMDGRAGLSFAQPARSQAAGATLVAQAATRQAQQRVTDLERTVRAAVVASTSALRQSVERWKSAATSVDEFQQALDGQRERLRLGMASVVEILTVEDRLTNALMLLAEAQLAYPQALLQLRFATGTLVAPDQPAESIDPRLLIQMPSCADMQAGQNGAARPQTPR